MKNKFITIMCGISDIKFFCAVIVLVSVCMVQIISQEYVRSVSVPAKGKVLVAGRVAVHTDNDMEFYADVRALSAKERLRKDICEIGDVKFDDGSFFFLTVALPKYREVELGKSTYLDLVDGGFSEKKEYSYFTWKYFGSDKMQIRLTTDFINFTVPDDANAVYIGTIHFYVSGMNFGVDNITVEYELDAAQKALDAVTSKQITLVSVELDDKENN